MIDSIEPTPQRNAIDRSPDPEIQEIIETTRIGMGAMNQLNQRSASAPPLSLSPSRVSRTPAEQEPINPFCFPFLQGLRRIFSSRSSSSSPEETPRPASNPSPIEPEKGVPFPETQMIEEEHKEDDLIKLSNRELAKTMILLKEEIREIKELLTLESTYTLQAKLVALYRDLPGQISILEQLLDSEEHTRDQVYEKIKEYKKIKQELFVTHQSEAASNKTI